jgi:hypothetical protein
MSMLRQWILSICGVAVISVVAMSLTPRGSVRGITKLVCGVVAFIVLIKPFIGFDFDAYSINLAQYRAALEVRENNSRNTSERLLRTIIEEECAAYILDKAQELSLEAGTVAVTAKWGDGDVWYPYEVWVDVSGEGENKNRMRGLIEADLGIPEARQYWSSDEDVS